MVYGAELGFGTLELIGALVLVQFVGIPFTLMFGAVTDQQSRRRGQILALLIVNIVAVPALGIVAAHTLDRDTVGRPDPAFATTGQFVGEGEYESTIAAFTRTVIGRSSARTTYRPAPAPTT